MMRKFKSYSHHEALLAEEATIVRSVRDDKLLRRAASELDKYILAGHAVGTDLWQAWAELVSKPSTPKIEGK